MSKLLDDWEIQKPLGPFQAWEKLRKRFNWFLLPAIIIGCSIALSLLKSKCIKQTEETLIPEHYFEYVQPGMVKFTLVFYVVLLLAINGLYFLLPPFEVLIKPKYPERFRKIAFRMALLLFISLPIIIAFFI